MHNVEPAFLNVLAMMLSEKVACYFFVVAVNLKQC